MPTPSHTFIPPPPPSNFPAIDADADVDRLTSLTSLCMNCHEDGETRLLLTSIPYFRDVILMSFSCPHCNFTSSEIQPAAEIQAKGRRFTLRVNHQQAELTRMDLNRQMIRSETARIRIDEIDFEMEPTMKRGEINTLEGLLGNIADSLEEGQANRALEDVEVWRKVGAVMEEVRAMKEGERSFTLVLDDPAGNSFIENLYAPAADPRVSVDLYQRTPQQTEELGYAAGADGQEEGKEMDRGERKGAGLAGVDVRAAGYTVAPVLAEKVETYFNVSERSAVLQSQCSACSRECETRMAVTNIPHFKEVVLMTTTCDWCLAEDVEVLTDRGFMSRAEVFGACPELAPSAPTTTTESDDDLPFGGAVLSREVSPLYWTPSAAEEAADAAAAIRHEALKTAKTSSSVKPRDSADRYGRQCGVCGARVWSAASRRCASTMLSQHARRFHAAERAATAAARNSGHISVAAASTPSSSTRRASLSTASTATSDSSDAMEVDDVVTAPAAAPAASASPLLFACLDPSTGHLEYRPATALTYKLVTSLVDFTHHNEAPHWADDADEYGLTPDQVERMKAQSERHRTGEKVDEQHFSQYKSPGVSLLVDPHHDMFVRVGMTRTTTPTDSAHTIVWAPDYSKVKAGALLSDDPRQRVRMMAYAPAGLASPVDELPFAPVLGLTTEEQVTAFLELYGYWIGDGCLDVHSRVVMFTPVKAHDKPWVLERLAILGLTVGPGRVTTSEGACGTLFIRVWSRVWQDYFFGEYGSKYRVASLTSSRPHTHTGLTTPLPKSVKWFWVWVWRLRKERARRVLAGLCFADGKEATDVNCIFTSDVHFRDEVVRLALHAGYAARFSILYKTGDHRGYSEGGKAIIARHDSWGVFYSEHEPSAEPVLHSQRDVQAVDAPRGATVPVWCVTVPPHHLIVVRRVRKNARGVVTQASKPVVVGQCGYRDSEVKPAGRISELGIRIHLRVDSPDDLRRDLLKSDSSSIRIPEIELDMVQGTLGGKYTTVEGILLDIKHQLSALNPFMVGDSAEEGRKGRFAQFLDSLDECIEVRRSFTFVLEDPLGNSHIWGDGDEGAEGVGEVGKVVVERFERSWEENEELGLNDVVVDVGQYATEEDQELYREEMQKEEGQGGEGEQVKRDEDERRRQVNGVKEGKVGGMIHVDEGQ